MKRLLIVLVCVLVLLVSGVLTVLVTKGRDIPPPDVSDLALDVPDLADVDNAYTYFCMATNSLAWTTNRTLVTHIIEGTTNDDAFVQALIDSNQEPLSRITQGNRCARCIGPRDVDFHTPLPHVRKWRSLARIMMLKSRVESGRGQHAAATQTCLGLLGFADLIQKDAPTLVHYLIGIAILEMGLDQTRLLARTPQLPVEQLKRLDERLRDLAPPEQGLIRAFKAEFHMTAAIIDDMRAGKIDFNEFDGSPTPAPVHGMLKFGYFLHPNRTKREFAELVRDAIANAKRDYSNVQLRSLDDVLPDRDKPIRFLLQPNVLGNVLLALMTPAWQRLIESKCRQQCSIAATRLIVACRGYEQDTGRKPDSLDALVPNYLEEVPADPYDGRPFRYLRASNIVYSVGSDLADDNGSDRLSEGAEEPDRASLRRWQTQDAVFRLANPANGRETP